MDCIDLFKRAAMALQTDSRYLAMDQARKMNDKDEELQNLIGEFNLARMDLNNEIGKPERSDERIAELNQKVNDLYGKIMADDGTMMRTPELIEFARRHDMTFITIADLQAWIRARA